MKEIEILVEIQEDINSVLHCLEKFEKKGMKSTNDIYYFDPLRNNLKLDDEGKLKECCRLREKAGKYYITYKIDNYKEDVWIYSDEYETEVKDIDILKRILEKLGLKQLVVIKNKKHTFETSEFEIVVEEVEGLGIFLEVEYIGDSEAASVGEIKKQIMQFIKGLNLKVGNELNSGKPELLLTRHINDE